VKNQFEDVSGGKFCLTEDELAKGLTIDKKLEKLCYGYSRMDQLFGNKQNVKPYSTMQSGLSMLIHAIGSDSEDEEDVVDKHQGVAPVADIAVKDVDNPVDLVEDCEVPAISTDTALNVAPPLSVTKKDKKDKKETSPVVPDDLKDLCSSTVKDHAKNLPNALSEAKRQKTQGGGLSGAYSEAKQVEAKLKRDELEWQKQHQTEKFMWDKENYADSFLLKKKEVEIKEQMVAEETKRQFHRDQEETKRQMALKLIEAGKDPEQTKAFLNALGYM
jgi:hypothetical protein